jgi:mono/diheme cytochrome c family protein
MKGALSVIGPLLLPVIVLGSMWVGQRDPAEPNRVLPTQMSETPAYKAQSVNPVLANSVTMQPPVEGTLARGARAFHYARTDADRRRAGVELTNPLTPTPENLTEGKRVYETFCAVCHGATGAGDGPVIPKYPNPPNLKSKLMLKLRDGEMLHTITVGRKKMPAHAGQLSWDERWQVILYIRSLQKGKGR